MAKSEVGASTGVSAGAVIAGLISWNCTHSLGWTLLHTIFGWLYVIYSWYIGRIHWA